MQAYGWSLPAKYSTEVAEGGKSLVSVPVPVYCRPLNLNDPGMKVSSDQLMPRKPKNQGYMYWVVNACEGQFFRHL